MANTIPQSSVPLSTTAVATTGAGSAFIGASANTGRCVYLTGFSYQASGATAATTVTITVAYVPPSGAQVVLGSWSYPITSTAANMGVPLEINLIPPMQSAVPITGGVNVGLGSIPVGAILVSFTAAGAGATFAGLNIWGYML